MPLPEGIQKATEFSLDDLLLVGSTGTSIDLREVIYELNLSEDLFSNTMSGSLVVNDTANLINRLPIVGMEFLLVTLSKPSTPWKIQKVFRVYKLTDRHKSSNASENYILHFCSEESVLSGAIRISKSYKGRTVTEIVKDICTTFLKVDEKKLPSSSLMDTQGSFDVVVPYWTPLYTINWVSRFAKASQYPGCTFVFYEDSEGFRFTSIEALTQQEPVQVLNFTPMLIHDEKTIKPDAVIRHEAVSEYALVNTPDMLQSYGTGTYAGKLTVVDPFSQRINVHTTSGTTLFNRTKHLNPYPYFQLNEDRTKQDVTKHYDSFFRVHGNKFKPENWVLQRNAYLAGLHGFQIKVEMPGNTILKAGRVVTLNMPSGSIATREEKPMDELYSGNYLITAVRHKIDRTKYICTLELSKDSVITPMPSAITANPALIKIRAL